MPVEEISNTGCSEVGTFHWASITPGRGGDDGLFFFFAYATWPPTTTPTFRSLLTPLHFSLATTNLAYLEARVCTRPHVLQIPLGVTATDDSCSTPFFSEAPSGNDLLACLRTIPEISPSFTLSYRASATQSRIHL